MPFSANSFFAFSFLAKRVSPMPRSTLTNDLYSVAPGVPKIKEWTIKYGNTSRLKYLAGRLPIIDHEAEVATIVCGLPAALLKSNKLIAQVDESHGMQLLPRSSNLNRRP